jgi:P-type E1-E2 ATPase
MIEMNIPGRGIFQIEYLVCDVNGTLAIDGHLLPGMINAIKSIKDRVKVYLITADTHGKQSAISTELGIEAISINKGQEAEQKGNFVTKLGENKVIAIGQGANDAQMLKKAAIGICVLSEEGTSIDALNSSDIIVQDGLQAIKLVQNPLRLVATLRR